MPVVEHNGKEFLVLRVSHAEGWDGYDVAAIELMTREMVAAWLEQLDLVVRLHSEHGADGALWVDYSAEYFPADWDHVLSDDEETPLPDWSPRDDWAGRTELDRMVVEAPVKDDPNGAFLYWTAYPKHGDDRLETYSLFRPDVVEMLRRYDATHSWCEPVSSKDN